MHKCFTLVWVLNSIITLVTSPDDFVTDEVRISIKEEGSNILILLFSKVGLKMISHHIKMEW